MKNLLVITGDSVFLQAHFRVPISYFITSSLSFCLLCQTQLSASLPACLSVLLPGWLAGYLAVHSAASLSDRPDSSSAGFLCVSFITMFCLANIF